MPQQKLALIFAEYQLDVKKAKDIKRAYRDALKSAPGYEQLENDLERLKGKKKVIIAAVRESMESELAKLDDLEIEIDSKGELITDMVVAAFVKGETVEVEDEYGGKWVPELKAKLKKL